MWGALLFGMLIVKHAIEVLIIIYTFSATDIDQATTVPSARENCDRVLQDDHLASSAIALPNKATY